MPVPLYACSDIPTAEESKLLDLRRESPREALVVAQRSKCEPSLKERLCTPVAAEPGAVATRGDRIYEGTKPAPCPGTWALT